MGTVRDGPRVDEVEEAREPGKERNLPAEDEREVRRCFRSATGDAELATSESCDRTSASMPVIAICVSSSCRAMAAAAIARAVGSAGFPAPLP